MNYSSPLYLFRRVHDIGLVDDAFKHTTSGCPACIYDPCLTVGSSRRLPIKNFWKIFPSQPNLKYQAPYLFTLHIF